MTTVDALLLRARTMLGRGTVYWAGTGGEDPDAPSAARAVQVAVAWSALSAAEQAELQPVAEAAGINLDDPALELPACDCSGFVSWALGLPRHLSPPLPGFGEWIFTDAIHQDALHGQRLFTRLDAAVPGCLMVYPKPADMRFGHVGIVSEVVAGRAVRLLHCSADNFRMAPFDAVKENATNAFADQPASIPVWCRQVSAR